MRRLAVEEEKERPVLKGDRAYCAICGAALEMDGESGEYLCPVCDAQEGQG